MVRGLPDGVSLDAAGTVSVDKLARMGARVYDPATMGFLSRDPLPGDPGSVWASNPYEYAANNPLMFSDPLGLKPLTDEQLQKHNDADNWMANHWKGVVGVFVTVVGAAITVGGTAMLTPIIGPLAPFVAGAIGGAVMSGGMTVATQGLAGEGNSNINWKEVGINSLIGGIGGGLASGGTAVMLNTGLKVTTTTAEVPMQVLARDGAVLMESTTSVTDTVATQTMSAGTQTLVRGIVGANVGTLQTGVTIAAEMKMHPSDVSDNGKAAVSGIASSTLGNMIPDTVPKWVGVLGTLVATVAGGM
jgi:RHS repeat-associated protein